MDMEMGEKHVYESVEKNGGFDMEEGRRMKKGKDRIANSGGIDESV